jgi:hypothetical protein
MFQREARPLAGQADEDGGGTAFADYVWKPVVLIEMKKRGTDLQKHYRQAFDYWTRLVPNRPRYVVLCNFDEFRIYDFDTDLDTPKDTLALTDLPERYGPLEFLAPGNPKPNFENDRVAVTKEAADTRRAMAGGVQGYIAFLRGKRVTYWGRTGDQHTEWFPGVRHEIPHGDALHDAKRKLTLVYIGMATDKFSDADTEIFSLLSKERALKDEIERAQKNN